MNILLFCASTAVAFAGVLCFYKLFNKAGLYAWIAVATIAMNVAVVKIVDLGSFSATLGSPAFASVFVAIDILTENHGDKESKRGAYTALASGLFFIAIIWLDTKYIPSETDFISGEFSAVFDLTPRITICSLSLVGISTFCDGVIYNYMKKKNNERSAIWLRSNVSTVIANCAENIIFMVTAFGGVLTFREMLETALVGSVIEIVLSIVGTPVVYRCSE